MGRRLAGLSIVVPALKFHFLYNETFVHHCPPNQGRACGFAKPERTAETRLCRHVVAG
jgi:hypothetical protein